MIFTAPNTTGTVFEVFLIFLSKQQELRYYNLEGVCTTRVAPPARCEAGDKMNIDFGNRVVTVEPDTYYRVSIYARSPAAGHPPRTGISGRPIRCHPQPELPVY